MAQRRTTLLDDLAIRAALKQAWEDSQPDLIGEHEEGGFILLDKIGNLSVVRWSKGVQNSIVLPPHPNCKFDELDIVATFHTHPNTGSDFLQEPSETDKRAVRDDPDLKNEFYEGEFVISQDKIYLISPNGQVNEMGNTWKILGEI
jgi:hypothetical protein